MKLTREKAIEYFNQKAPKKLREQGIVKMEEYAKGDESVFVINDVYLIRYITPEAYNCLMRNQRFNQTLKGIRHTKQDMAQIIDWITEKGGYSKQ